MGLLRIFTFLLLLVSQGWAAAFSLEITNIKPAGTGSPAIPSTNRIFRAYPGIEYNIRAAVIGGLYPFTYSLSNVPAGMTINASTGEISWPNPQANSGTITLSVMDAESTTVNTTWDITVSTSGFKFIDSSYSGEETGSIAQPFSSITNFMAASGATTDIVYFRSGTYAAPGSGEYQISGKGNTWIAYPGETVTVTGSTGAYLRSGAAIYLDGLNFAHYTGYTWMLWGGHHYQTIRRCTFTDIVEINGTNNNYGFIYWTSASPVGSYDVIQDNELSYFTGTSAIGSIYDCSKLLIEDNYIHDCLGGGSSGIKNGISAKSNTDLITVRHNRIIMNTGWPFGRGSMNGTMVATDGVDCSFNYFKNTASLGWTNTLRGENGTTVNIYFYRNTVVGILGFEWLDGNNCLYLDKPSGVIVLDHNVIVNENTGSQGNFFMHNYIGYGVTHAEESTSPWNCITDTSNLKGVPATGIVDSNGNLTSGYMSYYGNTGWQVGSNNVILGTGTPNATVGSGSGNWALQ